MIHIYIYMWFLHQQATVTNIRGDHQRFNLKHQTPRQSPGSDWFRGSELVAPTEHDYCKHFFTEKKTYHLINSRLWMAFFFIRFFGFLASRERWSVYLMIKCLFLFHLRVRGMKLVALFNLYQFHRMRSSAEWLFSKIPQHGCRDKIF